MDPHRNYNPLFYRDSIVIDVALYVFLKLFSYIVRVEKKK